MSGLYFEEFEVGARIRHEKRRTITHADNQRFCDLTMNQQPLHLDAAFAADTEFGERVVNGLYTMSLAVGLSIPDTTDGTIVANLGYDDVEHPEPVFPGDTLRAQTTVASKRETSDGGRGVVELAVEAFVEPAGRSSTSDLGDPDDAVDTADGDSVADTDDRGRAVDADGEVLVCRFERTVLSEKRPSETE